MYREESEAGGSTIQPLWIVNSGVGRAWGPLIKKSECGQPSRVGRGAHHPVLNQSRSSSQGINGAISIARANRLTRISSPGDSENSRAGALQLRLQL
jgi:hypothetical protein